MKITIETFEFSFCFQACLRKDQRSLVYEVAKKLDWIPASYTRGQSSYSRRYPACWVSCQRAALSPARHAMGPGNLVHPALISSQGGNSRHPKSRHPTVLAPQPISTSDENNISGRCGRITDAISSGWRT